MTSALHPRLALAAVGILGLVAAVDGQGGRRPMTIEDLIVAPRIADPQLSPDGRTVLYLHTTTDGKTGGRNADIHSVPADGSSAGKALIEGARSENTPRWSPDGKKIAFLSNREGGQTQVYVAESDGANVRKVSDVAKGAQPPLVWSPDGTRLAFVSDVYPDCADLACNKKRSDDAEKNPVKARRLTRLLYRHWDEWRENVRHHVFVADVANGEMRDITPGDFDSPPGQQEGAAIAFSPDGKTLAIVSNREGNDREAWTTNNDIFLVPVGGGEARKLTKNPAADTHPVFSKDGRTLFVMAQRRPGFESDRWYLDAYDVQSGAMRTLFTTPDLSVSEYVLSHDGTSIWFTAGQEARTNLFTVPAAGGTPKRVLQGGSISSVQAGGDFVVFANSSLVAPPEIFRAPAAGGAMQPLTRANETWVKGVEFSTPESLTVNAGGGPVQYWLIKPPAFNPSTKYPVLFLIHGGPQGVWGDAWSTRWNPSLWAAQGWVVVAPNPSGSTTFGQQMVDRISGDWAGRVMTEIDGVVNAAAKLPYVDSARMGIAGASYGGYAVNWIISQTNKYKAAVSHDGVFNLEPMGMATEELWFTDWEFGGPAWDPKARAQFAKVSPHLHAHKIKTPTLIITNELDFRVPVDQGLQMFTVLRRNGVPSEALVFPDEGHWVLKALNSRLWHESVFGWLKKYL
jgi:dipeptidyl aminopeptidase/acylaminoacyl peptidase